MSVVANISKYFTCSASTSTPIVNSIKGEVSSDMDDVTQNLIQPEDDNVDDINTEDTEAETEGLPTAVSLIIGEESKYYLNN